jgi:hypothetical protein
MSSLPFISHHLFVAAAGQDGQARRKPVRREPLRRSSGEGVLDAPLELLEDRDRRHAARAQTLRLAVALGET